MRDLAAGKFGGFQKGKSYWRSAAAAAHLCTTARCFQHMDLVPRVKKKRQSGRPSCPEVDKLDK